MKEIISKNTFLVALIITIGFSACENTQENRMEFPEYDSLLSKINLPQGFEISIYAANITDARSLARTEDGKTIFVGNRRQKNVYALTDTNGDYVADQVDTIATDLNMPNGVAYRNGDLYVAEVNQIHVFRDIMNQLQNPVSEVIYDEYPTDRHHGWKFIAFGPDGKLYVPVGAPCNVCDKEDENEMYASITRMNADGSDVEVFAKGVRNTVGFDWHPDSGEMWFTDNNRDMMGDDKPACELNHAPEAGYHFGFPYWHEGDIPDPDFGDVYPQSDFKAPSYKFEPHSAPLGIHFYQGDMFPEKYRKQALVAQHGSWNRSPEAGHTGYQLRWVQIENNEVVQSEIFVDGWLDKEKNEGWGKPVDILEMPDGSVLVSDDIAHCIYRISYTGA